MEKAILFNGIKMYKELDKIGAYPRYTVFTLKGIEYEIYENNKNYFICFDRNSSECKHIKIYKNKILSKDKPSINQLHITYNMTSDLLYDKYDDKTVELKSFIKRYNNLIYKMFKTESNPFNNLLKSL